MRVPRDVLYLQVVSARNIGLTAWVVLAMTADVAHAQALGERGSARVALASVQGPGLDFARLSHLFDAARMRVAAVLAPRAPGAWNAQRAAQGRVRLVIGPDAAAPSLKERVAPPTPVLPAPVVPTNAYRRTFSILLSRPEVTDAHDAIIMRHAQAYGLDPRLLKAIVAAESEFVFSAVSPKGARGLMQVMPRTAHEMGVDPTRLHDPEFNIRAGAAYLAHLFARAFKQYKLKGVRFHNAPLWLKQRVVAAYNAGPRFLSSNRWFRETREHVKKVILFYQSRVTEFRRAPEGLAALPALPVAPLQGTLY